MPQPLRKIYPALDLPKAQEQARRALRRAIAECGGLQEFTNRVNAELERGGHKTITRQSVQWWLSEGTLVDQRYWIPIEIASDYATTRRHLRLDRYPDG